jgi:dipeptidyl aminopeptidase/acylaminoacyl peptidase
MARGLASLAALAAVGATAGSAWASFPGANGTIVYGWNGAGVYRGAPESTSIRTVDPRSRQVRVLRDCPLRPDRVPPHPDCGVWAPRYSPDGTRIAFPTEQMAYPPGGGFESRPGLGVMASDGTGFEERSTAQSYLQLAWSPAGDRFLTQGELSTADGSERSAIFLTSRDGTELRQAGPAWSAMPDWSSRGQIAFVRDRNADPSCLRNCQEIFVTRLGGTPRRLTYRGGRDPSWAPDGTRLAFARFAEERRRSGIYVVRRNGRGLRQVTRGGSEPAWSPDGKWIAYIRAGDVYIVRTSGRGRRRLVDEQWDGLDGPQVTSVDWQPLPSP